MQKTKLLNNSLSISLRRRLRRNQTKSEEFVWRIVRNRRLGCKFRRQYGIGNYVVDFCVPENKLVIEIDGISHDGDIKYKKDLIRQKYIEKQGFTVYRYTDEYIVNNKDGVYNELKRLCHREPSPQPSP